MSFSLFPSFPSSLSSHTSRENWSKGIEHGDIGLIYRFTEMSTSRFVESAFWNFDSMFVPQQHPAREVQDTFYVKSGFSLLFPPLFFPVFPFSSSSPSFGLHRLQDCLRAIDHTTFEKDADIRPTKGRTPRRRVLSTSSESPRIRRLRLNRLPSSFLA